MKNPVAIFSSIAAVAAAALGTTLYMNNPPPQQVSALAPAETAEVQKVKPEEAPAVASAPAAEAAVETPAAPAVETPAAPVAETPIAAEAQVQQQAAVEPAPAPQQPAVQNNDTVVVLQPAPEASAPVASAEAQPVQQAAPILPSFDTVRVEATGDAIIAGRAAPESEITVKWNGNVVGTTKANADGSFVLVPANPLKTGIGAMTIEMTLNGKVSTSEGSVFVVVKKDAPATIAKVDPVAPTEVVQVGVPVDVPKDLQLTAVDYDSTGNIVFSGKAAPGTTVRFYVDDAATGEGKADAGGAWRFNGTSSVAPGTHTLRADAVDAEGKVLSRIELPFLREDAATVAAAQVVAPQPAPVQAPAVTAVAEQPAVSAETQVAVTPEPTPAPAPVAVVEEGPRKLVIQPGNNLWKLSREVYGKGRMYTIIYEANRELVKNPNRIYPGQILTAPKQP